MFAKTIRVIGSYRGPLPDHYRLPNRYAQAVFISAFMIAAGCILLLMASYFSAQPFVGSAAKHASQQPKMDGYLSVQMRAHAYMEAAILQTSIYQMSLDNIHRATDPDQHETTLRQAKMARERAFRHLSEAQAISLPANRQPDFGALRADLDSLDHQLAATPGTQGN